MSNDDLMIPKIHLSTKIKTLFTKRTKPPPNITSTFSYLILPNELKNSIFRLVRFEERLKFLRVNKTFRRHVLSKGAILQNIDQIDFANSFYFGEGRNFGDEQFHLLITIHRNEIEVAGFVITHKSIDYWDGWYNTEQLQKINYRYIDSLLRLINRVPFSKSIRMWSRGRVPIPNSFRNLWIQEGFFPRIKYLNQLSTKFLDHDGLMIWKHLDPNRYGHFRIRLKYRPEELMFSMFSQFLHHDPNSEIKILVNQPENMNEYRMGPFYKQVSVYSSQSQDFQEFLDKVSENPRKLQRNRRVGLVFTLDHGMEEPRIPIEDLLENLILFSEKTKDTNEFYERFSEILSIWDPELLKLTEQDPYQIKIEGQVPKSFEFVLLKRDSNTGRVQIFFTHFQKRHRNGYPIEMYCYLKNSLTSHEM